MLRIVKSVPVENGFVAHFEDGSQRHFYERKDEFSEPKMTSMERMGDSNEDGYMMHFEDGTSRQVSEEEMWEIYTRQYGFRVYDGSSKTGSFSDIPLHQGQLGG
jgi:hypothetical protein